MVTAEVSFSGKELSGMVNLPASKSINNRLLLLQKFHRDIVIENASNADDSVILKRLLNTNDDIIDCKNAGTVFRFLTAYFAQCEGKKVLLTGSERMKNRPIKPLVDALIKLGANIQYHENHGFPPLQITGKRLKTNNIIIDASVSSQFVSALLMLGTTLNGGLEIELSGKLVSEPYLDMTVDIINKLGGNANRNKNHLKVENAALAGNMAVEADWTNASYFLAMLYTVGKGKLVFQNLPLKSLQGDSILINYFSALGVHFLETPEGLAALLENPKKPNYLKYNLKDYPDLAQTFAAMGVANKIETNLLGLQSLVHKETNRILAIKNEIEKVGATCKITAQSISINLNKTLDFSKSIDTYDDHRMAMAFAVLGIKNNIKIQNPSVVEKSFPHFWESLKQLGFVINVTP